MDDPVYVDDYCERVAPGLFGEPLNAATNLAFFLGAFLAWRHARRAGVLDADAWALIALMAAIGIGSTTFHMAATSATRWGDLVPILLFQVTFLWIYGRRVMRLPALPTGAFALAFLAVTLYARGFAAVLSGSVLYAPAIVVLMVLAAYHAASGKAGRYDLAAATAVFLVSLTFRTLDGPLCASFPSGSHFVWHLLNPAVLYLCTRAVLRNPRAQAVRRSA